jgi:hypothetical protein
MNTNNLASIIPRSAEEAEAREIELQITNTNEVVEQTDIISQTNNNTTANNTATANNQTINATLNLNIDTVESNNSIIEIWNKSHLLRFSRSLKLKL